MLQPTAPRRLALTTNRLPGMPTAPDSIPANLVLRRKASLRSLRSEIKMSRRANNAVEQLRTLPQEGESLHFVVDGAWEPCDLIPAVRRMAHPAIIDSLYVCTLGFNVDNVACICNGIDQGKIKAATLVCSHYFEKSDASDYRQAKIEIEARGGRLFALRMHAKIFLMELSDGRCITIEGSGNLRSSSSIEQFCMTCDRPLLEFHREWIESYVASNHAKYSRSK